MTENENSQSGSAPETNDGAGMKTIVSWIIVLIVIIGGVFLFMNDSTPKEDGGIMEDGVLTNEEAEAIEDGGEVGENIVRYTDEGFLPNEITIKKGEIVTFINESESEMWVGSAIHPTHSVYPIKSDDDCLGSSFDQCESSLSGTTWNFTFDVEGEHGYHNHVRSNHWGKVIVE